MVTDAGSKARKEEPEDGLRERGSDESSRSAVRRVLLVDDDQNVLNALRRLLSSDEWDVWMATDEPPARDLLSNVEFDIIVSDQRMPGGTGLELCAFLRDLESSREFESNCKNATPFVLLTALPEQIELDSASRSRPDVIMAKPWDAPELISVLRKLVQRLRPAPTARIDEHDDAAAPPDARDHGSHEAAGEESGDEDDGSGAGRGRFEATRGSGRSRSSERTEGGCDRMVLDSRRRALSKGKTKGGNYGSATSTVR